jgi:hypothetical protein
MNRDDGHDREGSPSPGETRYEVIRRMLRNMELDLRVAAPAQVVTYNPATQRADLLLGFLPVRPKPLGIELVEPPVSLPQVPVAWMGNSTGYVTTQLLPGHTGVVVFCDRALGEWLRLGAPADPSSGRTHDLADGIFFPGPHPDTAPIVPPTDLTATVVEGPIVKLGRAATSPAVLGTQLSAAFTAWSSTLATAGAAAASGAPDPSGVIHDTYIAAVTTATATLAATIASWLSAKVQVQ